MHVVISRVRMACGEGSRAYAYDGLVPKSECPHTDGHTTIVRDVKPGTPGISGKGRAEYLNFVDATLPAAHYDMPKGWDRYEDFLAHEKRAKLELLAIAKRLYPELESRGTWPELWIEIPELDARHDDRWTEVSR